MVCLYGRMQCCAKICPIYWYVKITNYLTKKEEQFQKSINCKIPILLE